MKLKMKDHILFSQFKLVKLTGGLHPSRTDIHYHRLDKSGKLQPGKYLRNVIFNLQEITGSIKKFRNIDLHLVRRKEPGSYYFQFLPIIVAKSYDNQFDNLYRLRSKISIPLINIKDEEIYPALSRSNASQICFKPSNLPNRIFVEYGFELSLMEVDYLFDEILGTKNKIELPRINEGDITLGHDLMNKIVYLDNFNYTLIQNLEYIPYLWNNAIIITNDVGNYRCIEQSIRSTVVLNLDGFQDSELGINLLQLYTSYPQVLISIIDAIGVLAGNRRLRSSFLSVIDELYSTTPQEEFIGMNLSNMFIEDEFDSYQTLSDQQSKYELLTYFSQFLNHGIFNITDLDILQDPGIVLIDVSELNITQQIMIDILFRNLMKEQLIEANIISDIWNNPLQSNKFDNYSKLHQRTLCDRYIHASTAPSIKLIKDLKFDTILIESNYLKNMVLNEFEKNLLHLKNTWDYLNDELVVITQKWTTLMADIIKQEFYNSDILPEFKLEYRVDEESEEIYEIEYEDDDEELFDDTYLSHYIILSISREMLEYRRFQPDEVEVRLLSELMLDDYFQLMQEKGYLKEFEGLYELNAKGRTYVSSIRKMINDHPIDLQMDTDMNAFYEVNNQLLEILQKVDEGKFEHAFELLLNVRDPVYDIADKLEFNGLISHYFGLVGSLKSMIHDRSVSEQFSEYVKIVNTILDERMKDFDLFDAIINSIDEEDDFDEHVDKISSQIREQITDTSSITENNPVNEIIEEVISMNTAEQKPVFLPAEYPEIGIWHVTEDFLSVINEEVLVENQSITPVEAFFHQVIEHENISDIISSELILKRYQLDKQVITRLEEKGLLKIKGINISFETKTQYPKLLPFQRTLTNDEEINILSNVDQKSLRSQTLLQQLVKIFTDYGYTSETYLLHSLLIESDTVLENQIMRTCKKLKSYLNAELPEVPKNKGSKVPELPKVPIAKKNRKKIATSGTSLLNSLPKPKVKDNSNIKTDYLTDIKEPHAIGQMDKPDKTVSNKDDRVSKNMKYDLPDEIHSNLSHEYLQTFLEYLSQYKEASPEEILRKSIIHLFNHQVKGHLVSEDTPYTVIIELLNHLGQQSNSNFSIFTNSFSDIFEIWKLNPNDSTAISVQYFKRINSGMIYFDFDQNIDADLVNSYLRGDEKNE